MELIRPARPEDCEVLADLILLSDSGLLPALFARGAREAIAWLAARAGNPFSHRHAWVVDAGGEVVAAAVGSSGESIARERFSTSIQIARYFGLRAPARFAALARAGAATIGIEPSDFYLSNIVVREELQGAGRGTRLLLHTEASAREQGARRLVLDVDLDNRRAAEFYRKLGYVELAEVCLPVGSGRQFSYRRLVKSLAAALRPS